MGTSHSVKEFSRKIGTVGTHVIPAAVRAGIIDGAKAGKREFTGVLVSQHALVWRNSRRKSSVRYVILGQGDRTSAHLTIYGPPAHIREQGAKPHVIRPRQRGSKRAVSVPGVGAFAWVQSPGVRARPFFHPAANAVAATVVPIVKKRIDAEMARHFR